MSIVTLLPQSGIISRTGTVLQGQNGQVLSTAPTTGNNSPSYFIQNGISSPDESTYWSNTLVGAPNVRTNFYVGVDKMSLSPSGLILKVRANNISGGTNYQLKDFEVWLKKEHNPSIVSDIQVASGLSIITVNSTTKTNYSSTLQIIEANRTAFESGIPNNYLTVSGIINFVSGPIGSGSYFLYEMELELSGNFPLASNNCDLYMFSSDSSSENCNLYTASIGNSSGNCDLYTLGSLSSSGNCDLYITAPQIASGNCNLYMFSLGNSSGNCDLYTQGSILTSGNFDLFMLSLASQSGSMNLVTFGPIGTAVSGNYVPLNIWSASNSGLFSTTDLTVWNVSTFNPVNAMNMVTQGPSSYGQTASLNLVLSSDPSSSNQCDLYLCNNYALTSGWIPLYITTPSGTENSVPLSGTLNLIMGRSNESIAEWIPLVLSNGGSENNNIPMYIFGNTEANSGVNLYMAAIDSKNNSIPMFTSGF